MAVLKTFLGAFAGAFVALITATIGITVVIGMGSGSDLAGWGLIIMLFASFYLIPAFFIGIGGAQILARVVGGGVLVVAVMSAIASGALSFLFLGVIMGGEAQTFGYTGMMSGVAALGGAVGGAVCGLINRESRGLYG